MGAPALSLAWPWALLAALAVPLIGAIWWWMRRRRRRLVLRLPSLALVRLALPATTRWRRRIPVVLFVAGLLVLTGGVARPQAQVQVPHNETTFLLALDVSGSMCATDVPPNRLTAAVQAAHRFIQQQPAGTRIGIIAFSGNAQVIAAPTSDHEALQRSLQGLTTERATAIGMAILAAIDAVAQIDPAVAPTGDVLGQPTDPADGTGGSTAPGGAAGGPVADGEYQPETIVVLTDGQNTRGVDPVTAAGQAAARRLRIYTIGFGTTNPTQLMCTPGQVGDGGYGGGFGGGGFGGGYGGGGGGRRFSLSIDEQTLKTVAGMTGGTYYRAQDAAQLNSVLLGLPKVVTVQRQTVELTVWFTLAGAVLAMAGVGLSLWWNRGPR
jgi:Ca-activated chloride channel family protein